MTQYAQCIEDTIQHNGGGGGGGRFTKSTQSSLTMAELALLHAVKNVQSGTLDYFDTNCYDQLPGILATVQATKEHAILTAYYESKK
jgi:hypothetical protein